MVLNGKKISLECEMTVEKFLEAYGYQKGTVAVMKNDEIVPRQEFGSAFIRDSDRVEVVRFVGGGSI